MNGEFEDQVIAIESVFGALRVTITAEALHGLWMDKIGPQDATGLIAANRDLIAQIATMKFEADEGEDEFAVRITNIDLDV